MSNTVADVAELQAATAIAAQTMLGDLMKLCIDEMKAMYDIWERMSEDKQDEAIGRVETRCRSAVEQCVRIIATTNKPCIRATVEQVLFKDGIKAVVTASKGNADRHELADATGSDCLIVLPYAEQFAGGADHVKADPDQREIGFDQDRRLDL